MTERFTRATRSDVLRSPHRLEEQQESNFSVNRVFFRACISRLVSDKRPGQVISRAGVFHAGRVKRLAFYIQKDRAAGIYCNVGVPAGRAGPRSEDCV